MNEESGGPAVPRGLLALVFALTALPASAQAPVATATAERPELEGPDFTGVYQLVPNGVALPGGLRNLGKPRGNLSEVRADQGRMS
jgi:hypothetical protein